MRYVGGGILFQFVKGNDNENIPVTFCMSARYREKKTDSSRNITVNVYIRKCTKDMMYEMKRKKETLNKVRLGRVL